MRLIPFLPTRLLLSVLSLSCGFGFAAAAELESDTREATAGYFRLSWQADQPVQLVEARHAQFRDARIIYSGDDTARVMSGKSDGDWHYRLETRDNQTPVGPSITVSVRHHSLGRAGAFFGLGAFIFISTWALIAIGQKSAGRQPDGNG